MESEPPTPNSLPLFSYSGRRADGGAASTLNQQGGDCRKAAPMSDGEKDDIKDTSANNSSVDTWTCCGQSLISGKQKRCGKCNKWRGGKRDPYLTKRKNPAPTGVIEGSICAAPSVCDEVKNEQWEQTGEKVENGNKWRIYERTDAAGGAQFIGQRGDPTKTPSFPISDVRRRDERGATLCSAIGCGKKAQAKTKIKDVGSFCRGHFHTWLIDTGHVEHWDCKCGNKIPTKSERCGKCHRWKDKKSATKKWVSLSVLEARNGKGNFNENPITQLHPASRYQISNARKLNDNGRVLCKIVGCTKLDQAKNDGFCRTHFNLFSAIPSIDNNGVDDSLAIADNWTCCGQLLSGKGKRCGKCNKVRVATISYL